MYSNLFQMQTGIEFEDELTQVCISHFQTKSRKVNESEFKNLSGTDRDKFEGTDVEIYKVGVDFTFNFGGKDHMEVLPGEVSGRFVDFKFGVRTGNSHKGYTKFAHPVLVIGFSADSYYVKNYMANIVDDFRHHIEEIIDVGQGAYWDWMDLHPEYN